MRRTYLATLVAVTNDVLRSALTNSCLHRVQHQLCPQVVRHRPADDLAAPGVQHDSEIQEPGGRRHIRKRRGGDIWLVGAGV